MTMKKMVSCLFSLLLILLIFCTLVSPKAEEEMRTLVEAKRTPSASTRDISVAKLAVTWQDSHDILFNITEGSGWESGLRLAEIPSRYYSLYDGHLTLGPGTDFYYLLSASREPVAGDPVTVVHRVQKGSDRYLLWSPSPMEALDSLPTSMTLEGHCRNAALVSVPRVSFPYFEHRTWYSLKDTFGSDIRSYSLTEVGQFANALPWIAGIALVLLCCVILWGTGWLLHSRGIRGRIVVCSNGLLILGLLSLLPWLLQQFDLPASLLPAESILDISHYHTTFTRIFSALKTMGESVTTHLWEQMLTSAAAILTVGLLLSAAVVTAEVLLCRSRKHTAAYASI